MSWFNKIKEFITEPTETLERFEFTLDDNKQKVKRRLKPWFKRVANWITIFTILCSLIGGILKIRDWVLTESDRQAKREEVVRIDAAKRTLTKLYYSWETKDLPTYIACWDPTCVQISDIYTRDYNKIVLHRTDDFSKYKRVVIKYVKFESLELVEKNLIEVYTMYAMHFEPKNGTAFNEMNVQERFHLLYNEKNKFCKIVRNDTYLNREVTNLLESNTVPNAVPMAPVSSTEILMMETTKSMPERYDNNSIGPKLQSRWEALPGPEFKK
jgi:hypothetical protein